MPQVAAVEVNQPIVPQQTDVALKANSSLVSSAEAIEPLALADDTPMLASELNATASTTPSFNAPWVIAGGLLGTAGLGALAGGGGGGGGSSAPSSQPSSQKTPANQATTNAVASKASASETVKSSSIITAGSSTTPSGTSGESTKSAHQPTQNSQQDHATEPSTITDNTTTRVMYQNGVQVAYTHSKEQTFDITKLKYTTPVQNISNKAISLEEKLQSFKQDSDGDGYIDIADRDPKAWNVSERDLRMFASLAYDSPHDLKQTFHADNADFAQAINREYFLNAADVRELTEHWQVLKTETTDEGLSYVVFGNYQADGTLQNAVVAFRGTDGITSIKDWDDNLKVAFSKLPDQVETLQKIAEYVASLNPVNVYSTGHSLGGYLAQYFASHTMQSNKTWAESFERSALFNPAKLNVDSSSPQALKEARAQTDKMVTTKSDTAHDDGSTLYQSNSYVIKGEWVSAGIPEKQSVEIGSKLGFWTGLLTVGTAVLTGGASLAATAVAGAAGAITGKAVGAGAGYLVSQLHTGLGTYENANMFEFKSSDWWGKHDMSSFYEYDKTLELQKYFSAGTRMDKHYNNPYSRDTDNDGFSDGIEAKLNANPNDATDIPLIHTQGEGALAENNHQPFIAIVQTENAQGEVLAVKGVEMQAKQEGEQWVFTPTAIEIDLGLAKVDWETLANHEAMGGAIVTGSHHADTLQGSQGNDVLWGNLGNDVLIGGEGEDVFVFTAQDVQSNTIDQLMDFNGTEDKLDLSGMRELFADHGQNFAWSDVFVQDNVSFDHSLSSLHFDSEAQTLSYRASGATQGMVFAQFDAEQALALSASQLIG